jgi:hypothetical protein
MNFRNARGEVNSNQYGRGENEMMACKHEIHVFNSLVFGCDFISNPSLCERQQTSSSRR